MSRRFQRTVEDFVCINCGFAVAGNGYTNHCPICLFSRHVDVNPGDRLAECGGAMAPVTVAGVAGDFRILHRCRDCGYEKWNKAATEDDFQTLLLIAERHAKGHDG